MEGGRGRAGYSGNGPSLVHLSVRSRRGGGVWTGHKTSCQGSVLCGKAEKTGGEGGGRSRAGYSGNRPSLCTHSHVHEGEEAVCTSHKMSHRGSVLWVPQKRRAERVEGGRESKQGYSK